MGWFLTLNPLQRTVIAVGGGLLALGLLAHLTGIGSALGGGVGFAAWVVTVIIWLGVRLAVLAAVVLGLARFIPPLRSWLIRLLQAWDA